ELLDQPVEVLIPERVREGHLRHRSGYVSKPTVRPMSASRELLGRRKDASEFAVEISLSPLETESGLLITSAVRDVTERREAELATQLLAAIVDSSEDAIISTTLSGHI